MPGCCGVGVGVAGVVGLTMVACGVGFATLGVAVGCWAVGVAAPPVTVQVHDVVAVAPDEVVTSALNVKVPACTNVQGVTYALPKLSAVIAPIVPPERCSTGLSLR